MFNRIKVAVSNAPKRRIASCRFPFSEFSSVAISSVRTSEWYTFRSFRFFKQVVAEKLHRKKFTWK